MRTAARDRMYFEGDKFAKAESPFRRSSEPPFAACSRYKTVGPVTAAIKRMQSTRAYNYKQISKIGKSNK